MTSGLWEQVAAAFEPPDTFGRLGFIPNDGPQTAFLDDFDAPNTDQGYGGAAGGGKSHALLMGALRACHRHPGLQAFWFRRTFPELETSVLRLLARYRFARDIGAMWNASRYELRFPNGSILTFAHAKNAHEASALQSSEIQLLILDERTTIPPDVIELLYTRVRSGVPGLPCLGIRSATNPGGVGHGAFKATFIDGTGHGARAYVDDFGRRVTFIQSKATDTPQLDGAYVRSLDGLSEALRKAFRDGDWDVFAGQVFTEWRRDRHIVPAFPIPTQWRRYVGIDYGYAAPFAAEWFALDADGRAWVYRERYGAGYGEAAQASMLLDAQAGEPVQMFADSAMWARTGEGMTVAETYMHAGLRLAPADKGPGSRLIRKARLHTYLADAPACPIHRDAGWTSCPKLHVLDGAAPNLVRTIPNLPYDRLRVEDVDTDAEDHAYDALTYALVMVSGGTGSGIYLPGETTGGVGVIDATATAPPGWAPEPDWRDAYAL